jgi:hypothetical protein
MLEVDSISGETQPYVAPATLPNGTVGIAYSETFLAVGGNPATRQWSVSSGTLPPGVLLDSSTGTISGTITSSAASSYSFGMTAKDTTSGRGSQPQTFSIAVTGGPSTIAVTVTSVPAGRLITVDGTSYTAPKTFTWAQGSGHTIGVPSPQGTGTRFVFADWSDSGAQTHTIRAPASQTTYTANFTTQFLLTTGVSPNGAGTVAANPPSGDGYYNSGASVQLTAKPAKGYAFSAFSGGLTGAANPLSLVMSEPRTVKATFVPVVSTSKTPSGNF